MWVRAKESGKSSSLVACFRVLHTGTGGEITLKS